MAQLTSEQRRAIPHLEKYRCRVCHKWKEPASFSNKELAGYAYKYGNGNRLNGITANLRCRGCSGGAVTEKFCEGPCKTWKDLQHFSKASRSNGGSHACKMCVLWVESQEPGMVTSAPPAAGNNNGDDDDDDGWTPGASTYSDPEAGDSGSDYEEPTAPSIAGTKRSSNIAAPTPGTRQAPSLATSSIGPRQHIAVPYDGLAVLSLNGTNTASNSATGRTMATAKLSTPTMSGARIAPGSALLSGTGTGSRVGSRNTATQNNFDIRSQSSVSNPYETASSAPSGVWGALDARRRNVVNARAAPVTFTGWDNTGRPHHQQRTASGSGQQSSALSSGPTPPPAAPVPTRKTNWASPIGSRSTPAPDFPQPDAVDAPVTNFAVSSSRTLVADRDEESETDNEHEYIIDLYDS